MLYMEYYTFFLYCLAHFLKFSFLKLITFGYSTCNFQFNTAVNGLALIIKDKKMIPDIRFVSMQKYSQSLKLQKCLLFSSKPIGQLQQRLNFQKLPSFICRVRSMTLLTFSLLLFKISIFIISTLFAKINFSFPLLFPKTPITCSITDKHSIFKVQPLNFRTTPINMRWQFYYERAFFFLLPYNNYSS